MDRMDEYKALLQDLEDTPQALADTVQRAKARHKRTRSGRWFGIPLGSLAAACAAFVLLVNFCTPFAMACSKIPVLKDLASAVSFSPSLSAALEHDYVQLMNLTQTDGEVSMTINYVIVDQKQVNIFYTLSCGPYGNLDGYGDFLLEDGSGPEAAIVYPGPPQDSTEVRRVTLDFPHKNVPDTLQMDFSFRPLEENGETADVEPVANFSFLLRFDPKYTEQGRTVEIGKWITVDGQRLYAKSAEIYPTHFQLNLEDDEANSAWLTDLDFYLEDETGTRYEQITNGISGFGSENSPFHPAHRLESSFFGDAEHLTVYLTGAEWLDKDRTKCHIDLSTQTATGLPDGVALTSVTGKELTFSVPFRSGRTSFSPFGYHYWDSDGTQHELNGHSIDVGDSDDFFSLNLNLAELTGDQADLEVSSNRYTVLPKPVAVPVE